MKAIFCLAPLALMLGAASPLASDIPVDRPSLEQRVLAELNRIRAAPSDYVEDLRTFQGWFDGALVRIPGMELAIQTREGVPAVREAMSFAERQEPVQPLEFSPLLAQAAADQAQYLAGGADDHFWADGTGPSDRLERRGGGPNVGEIISFGFDDSREVARAFIVDDGVPNRGHRQAVFSARYRYAGVACGPHPRYRALCVVELSPSSDGR